MCDANGRQKSKMATHKQEILMFVSRHFGYLTCLASHTIETSFIEFYAFENMGYCRWNFQATMYTG